ncbi:unnamed protein product [Adineta steineri]|uniref:Phosphoinositide phospholipase C n=2 Tax=Adineta steineri TaxID=433720 RepID=A0A818W0Q3_9BILA|nr:unnamed protein product [Adineta steineri]
MLSVPLSRVRSPKLKRQTPVEDEIDGSHQLQSLRSIGSEESNSSRSLSPYWRYVADPDSSSSYLDVPETTGTSRRSSNNSAVRFSSHDTSDLCSILDMTCESENLEKAIISNDKYTVRRIIDIHQNKFNLIKDRSSISRAQSDYPIHPLPPTQPTAHTNTSFGSPSITSNTDLLEVYSKQALFSNDTDEQPSISSPEHTTSMFDAASSILTYTTGPLAAALINCHHHTHSNNHLTSNPSSINIGSSIHDRCDTEHESMFTAATSFNKETKYPTSDSPNDAPPIFRNVLHVAITYDARDVMRICLKYGIDPNAPGVHPNNQNTILSSALCSSNTYSQLNTRLTSDLPRASPCRNGTLDYTGYYTDERLYTLPPLFLAAQRNNHYACVLLLKYGANVNVRDELHCSPLHLAARLKHNACNILISHHASITIPNKYGDTPLSLWPYVKVLQTEFVEFEFRKLCRKHSSNSKRHRFLTRDAEHYQTTTSLLNYNNSSMNSGLIPSNGLRNLKRVFRYSGSDSYDSKSFKKSFSSQSSMGKSRRLFGTNAQNSIQGASAVPSESRQISEDRDDIENSHGGRISHSKRKAGTSSLAASILHAHKSSRQQQHSTATAAQTSAETNALNDRLTKRFAELSRLATNIECIDQLMDLLRVQNSMDEILALISQVSSPQVHAKIAELLHTLLNTSYQEFQRNHDKRDHIETFQNHTKKLLDISLELLSSDMSNVQYLALLTINRLYDIYVYHNLINPGRYNACYIPTSRRQLNQNLINNYNSNIYDDSTIKNTNSRSRKSSTLSNLFRRISRENDDKRPVTSTNSKSSGNTTQQTSGTGVNNGPTTDIPRQIPKRWISLYSNDTIAPSSSTSTLVQSPKGSTSDLTNSQSSKAQHLLNLENFPMNSNENSNTIYTFEPFSLLYQIEPIHLLRLMRTHLDAHRKEFNNRPKCVPSTRSPLCTHHCVVILAARLLTILCQDHTFQLRFIGTKENLVIIIDMLNINNDPHLICLILQTLGVVALNPDSHDVLTQADIPDTVLHLILPADEMFYTNQTTKFARYVKHLGARILVYMGLLTKVSNKVNLFDILDVEPEPVDCDKPQSFENNFVHHMAIGETIVGTLWASFTGICIEKLLDELLKNGINQKKSTSKESQDMPLPPTSPTSATGLINSNDNLLYNLSYLSAVIHPVIILRLLEHRIFTPLFKKKSITINQPIISNDNKNNNLVIPPTVGTSALISVPTLPRPDTLLQQGHSIIKHSLSNTDNNNRKTLRGIPSASISFVSTTSSQSTTNNDLTSNVINSTDLSSRLAPATTTSSSTNNSNPLTGTTRKWFWRNPEKNLQTNIASDRNPLLQSIVENDPTSSSISVPPSTTNTAGVGEIKLLEKELLNLPSFQLSDSQNPLLPSPTSLNYDFSTPYDQTSPTVNVIVNRQYVNTFSNELQKSKLNNDDFTSSLTNNAGTGLLTTHTIPFVAVRTPSDDSNHSSSINTSLLRRMSSSEMCNQQSSLNTRTFVRKTVENFFRSSKTTDNMSTILVNKNNLLTNISKCNRNIFKLKSSSHLSHSQPTVNETLHCESPLINHNEHSPLIDRRVNDKLKISVDNKKKPSLNRQGLHLQLDTDCLQRSRSYADGIIIPTNNQEIDLINTPPITSLQPNNSDAISMRSSDSTVSSLSAYLSTQRQSNQQLNAKSINDLNKSQESIFSFSSPTHKQRSIKSLIMAATTRDKSTKQENDVLVLIASWVLRSPEDFQDYLVQKELKSFFTLLESLRSSFRIWTSQIKEILALQDTDVPLNTEIDDVTTDDIYREYVRMQRDIVSGRLICSKEEAAALAAVQLRLETWPEENLDLAEEDELQALNIALNDRTSAAGTHNSLPTISRSWRYRHRYNLVKFRLADISCCKHVDSNIHKSKKPFLPPNFRHSNEILKLIKDKQRKLFHINDYDNPTRLKECYVRLCRNLPSYSAEIYIVKEIHGKRSKRKGNRLLCIRSDKICLLNMKTRIIYKEQRIVDLEHWITSGHHLSAGINELVLEFRNKTKWRLQLNNTADLRAITVYLWKIVNVEGFALLDKHIPLNSSMRRTSQPQHQIGRRMTLLPTSLSTNSNKNPYQTITDLYKNLSNNQTNQHMAATATTKTTDHIQNLTRLMQNTRTTVLPSLMINSSYLHPSDHTQPFCFSSDLEELKHLFDFPEEVAIRLTEIEHEIFLSVPPLQYLRHLTLDMSLLSPHDTSIQGKSIRILVQRFQAVGSFIQQLIVSQTSFQERKAIVTSIVRCAITCWYMGNFNSAMQILAGLKIEAFRPLWLTITDEIPGFKFLTDAFNSNEKTPQYCDAVSRALDIPTCKVVPFFGTFLKDLRTILSGVPSIVVLCNRNTQKPFETVSDFQNQEHFLTRIGVGGLINTRKIELVHMVLKDIAMFHNRHRRLPLFKCCFDLNRIKLPRQSIIPEMKEKHSATVCVPFGDNVLDQFPKPKCHRIRSFSNTAISDNEFDHHRMPNIAIQVIGDNDVTNINNNEGTTTTTNSKLSHHSTYDIDEPETYYCLNVSFYQPIIQPKHNHEVSLLSMHHIIDFNNLQILRNGTTMILYDEDTMHSCLITVRLELDNCTLTWTKPSWDTHRNIENVNATNQISSEAAHYSILMKRYILRDVAFVDMDEGFLQLKYVKHIRSGILHCDLLPIIKRYKLNDITNPENCFTIIYGSSISENKSLCFISPKYCSQIWYSSIDKLIVQYRKHRLCSDRRIVWLKNQYLSLFHENERFEGPTPMTAILIFGGRQWNSSSLFSYERDHVLSKKSNSVMKSWSNLGLRRRNKFEQDRKASFSTESEPSTGLKWQQQSAVSIIRNKSKTLDYKIKSNLASQMVKPARSLIQHQTNTKQRSGLVNQSSSNILNNPLNNKRNRVLTTNTNTQLQDSSSPWIINESHMDFPEFVELFKSFYFHCRRDLKDLFDKFASEINTEQDYTIKEQYKNDSFDISRHLTGLITRNMIDDITDASIRRIYDMIAISSIPCYAISTHTRGNFLITKEQFREFLLEHQKEDKTSYEIEQIIYRHEPNRQNRVNKVLSLEGFSRFLLDKENYAFVNEHTKVNEQEMDSPLSYYFVASSHNTYLTGHQLRGESSVEMYREVLLSGCRCVELDCWDGDDGYPVIYHGRTFVSKISFKLVVEVINESAFITSPYPVILSIENRCSLIQQARMAQTFVKVFGDKLITKYMFDTDFHEDPLLPSPNQLKHKILIKNKKINKMHSATQLSRQKVQLSVNYRNSVYSSPDENEEDDDSDDDELLDDYSYDPFGRRESQRSNSITDSPLYQLKKATASIAVEQDGDDDLRGYRQRRYSIMVNEPRQRLKSSSSIDATHNVKINKLTAVPVKIPAMLVAKELSDIVIYTQAIKFRGLTCASTTPSFIGSKGVRKVPRRTIQQLVAQPSTTSTESSRSIDQVSPCHQIVSLIENKAKKLCKNQGADMVVHTENQLVRCYPSGFRVDSTNFNPLQLWIYGIQLAATNYQTLDPGQILNLSMFEQNGNCGYVIKPSIFWDKEHPQYGRFNPSVIEREGFCFELTITVISGQYLTQNLGSTTSIYIEVELLGIPIDCMSRKTKPSIKNSLNPIWQETFVFQLFFIELAFVRFHVYDSGSNHLLSQRVMPLKCLRPGYRHVRLRDIANVPLELATLFIYSKTSETILLRTPEQDLSSSNTPHLFRNRIFGRATDTSDVIHSNRDSIRPKHKTFEVKVYGKEGRDEEFRPFAVTQYTTVEELIEMIAKTNDFLQVGETINDIILTESSKTWKKKASSSKQPDIPPRILEKHERVLVVMDRVGRETVILCKKKAQTPQHVLLSTLADKNIQNWENCDRTFLVTIYNISSIQKHTTFRTPINSTAIHVITQLMKKMRMAGIPNDYGLVEEIDVNGTNRRIPIKRRLLADDEKIYGIQRLWTSTNSKFVLVKKTEYTETNNNKAFTDKFLFRSLTRQKSIERELHEESQSKSRTTTTSTSNGTFNNNNRSSLAATPPISKTNQSKRSLKTLFSANKS